MKGKHAVLVGTAVIMGILVTGSLFATGQSEGAEVAEAVHIHAMVRNYTTTSDAPWHTAVEAFQRKYPNATVQIEGVGYSEQREKALVTVAAGQGPDLIQVDCIWLGEMAANNIIIDITDRVQSVSELWDDYLPTFRESSKWQDRIYGLWLYTDVRTLNYRKDLFEQAGLDPDEPPRTWSEFREYARAIARPEDDMWGFGFPASARDETADRWYPFLWMGGGDILNDDFTQAAFNSRAGVQALQLYVDMVNTDNASPVDLVGIGNGDVNNGFVAGNYAMKVKVGEFYGQMGDMSDSEYNDLVGVAPLPVPAGGNPATGAGGWLAGITRDAENPDMTFEFLTMVVDSANMEQYTIGNGKVPTRRSMLGKDDQYRAAMPNWPVVEEVLPTAHFRPWIPEYEKISAEIVTAIQKAILMELSAKDALDEAADRVDAILADRDW